LPLRTWLISLSFIFESLIFALRILAAASFLYNAAAPAAAGLSLAKLYNIFAYIASSANLGTNTFVKSPLSPKPSEIYLSVIKSPCVK